LVAKKDNFGRGEETKSFFAIFPFVRQHVLTYYFPLLQGNLKLNPNFISKTEYFISWIPNFSNISQVGLVNIPHLMMLIRYARKMHYF
jgi:hypothetical protein